MKFLKKISIAHHKSEEKKSAEQTNPDNGAEKKNLFKQSAEKKSSEKKIQGAGNTTLRKQMVRTVNAVFIATIILIILAGFLTSDYTIKKKSRDDMTSVSAMADLALSAEIQNVKSNAESVARIYNTALTDGNTTAFLRIMKTIESYGFIDAALVSQNQVQKTNEFLSDATLKEEPCVQSAKGGKTVLTSTQVMDDGTVRFMVAATTYNGCIVLTLDSQYFSEKILDVTVGETGNVFMIDSTGVMIASKTAKLVDEQQNFIEFGKTDRAFAGTAAVYTRMIKGETGVDEYSYSTGNRICAFHPVSNSDGWSVGAVVPTKEMFSEIIFINVILLICGVVSMAVGAVLIGRYATSIVDPIRKVTERMRLLAAGDLSSEVEISDRKDEIGVLSRGFYETVEALKSYIEDIGNVLHEVSVGNLQVTPQADFQGEFTEIRSSLEQILGSLNETFREIMDSASRVSSSAAQFSAGAQTLSQGATEQASSVEELAATISEINEHISSSSHSAAQASERIRTVGDEAEESDRRMDEMLSAMSDIRAASDKISKIIKTIEDIAFQTNILALNAAVEAARAGSAGKGFAVVADEVRNLAGKSAEASKDTAALIENAMAAVQRGAGIADQTAQSLEQVVTGVGEVSKTMEEISESSAHQATAASQINMGIEQISGVVQTNSATAEESAATSDDLLRQAQALLSLVEKFKVR